MNSEDYSALIDECDKQLKRLVIDQKDHKGIKPMPGMFFVDVDFLVNAVECATGLCSGDLDLIREVSKLGILESASEIEPNMYLCQYYLMREIPDQYKPFDIFVLNWSLADRRKHPTP